MNKPFLWAALATVMTLGLMTTHQAFAWGDWGYGYGYRCHHDYDGGYNGYNSGYNNQQQQQQQQSQSITINIPSLGNLFGSGNGNNNGY